MCNADDPTCLGVLVFACNFPGLRTRLSLSMTVALPQRRGVMNILNTCGHTADRVGRRAYLHQILGLYADTQARYVSPRFPMIRSQRKAVSVVRSVASSHIAWKGLSKGPWGGGGVARWVLVAKDPVLPHCVGRLPGGRPLECTTLASLLHAFYAMVASDPFLSRSPVHLAARTRCTPTSYTVPPLPPTCPSLPSLCLPVPQL